MKTIKFKGIEFEEVDREKERYDYKYPRLRYVDKKGNVSYFLSKKKKQKKCSKCGQVVKG